MAVADKISAPPFEFDFDARYRVDGWGAIAWYAYDYESEPDEDTEWTGYEIPTGRVLMVMVGDDRTFSYEPDEITAIDEDDYCHECGQIGCTADGRDRPGRVVG